MAASPTRREIILEGSPAFQSSLPEISDASKTWPPDSAAQGARFRQVRHAPCHRPAPVRHDICPRAGRG